MRTCMSLPDYCPHCNEDYSYKQEGLSVIEMMVKLKCKCKTETILLSMKTNKGSD